MHNPNNYLLNIACAIDDAFVFPLSVMLVSLFENNKKHNIKVHLFSAALSHDNISKIEKQVARYGQAFQFYSLNQNRFLDLRVSDRMSHAAYYRILMPDIIDLNVDKFLYLDSDIIVIDDIAPLFTMNMDEKIIGAVNDIAGIDCNMHKRYNIPEQFLYFNSGVLLVDRGKWIDKYITEKVFAYLKNNIGNCENYDQDALNAVLCNHRFYLSPVWNLQIGLYFIKKEILNSVFKHNYLIALSKPVIIHFNGFEKPWHYASAHPYRKLFKYYASVVAEFSFKEKFQFNKFIKKHIIYFIFGWAKVNKYYYYKIKSTRFS